MYKLRMFFQTGRKPNGSYMGETENVRNATERNLSCCTDAELLALRDEAREFATLCEATVLERDESVYSVPTRFFQKPAQVTDVKDDGTVVFSDGFEDRDHALSDFYSIDAASYDPSEDDT